MSQATTTPRVPAPVCAAFELDPESPRFVATGHINRTWMVRRGDGAQAVLQRLNGIFPAAVHRDIDTVTRHLQAKGLVTPRLLPTRTGRLWHEEAGEVWRLQTFIGGESRETLGSDADAAEAGRILGAFHAALADLEHDFQRSRFGAHDTERHLAALESARHAHRGHRDFAAIDRLAAEVLALAADIDGTAPEPARIVHGDPKVSNILFDPHGREALCLIDLDTLARMPVAVELGDAFRSWCNTDAEDAPGAGFSLSRFEAALAGYRAGAGDLLEAEELRAIPAAAYRIAVELAARFCADALAESYFAWDRARFASASEHNRVRARAQLDLAHSIAAQRTPMAAAVARVFARR